MARSLSPKIAGKFQMSGRWHVGIYDFAGKVINLETCTEAEALYMVDNGATFIEVATDDEGKKVVKKKKK